MYPQAFKKQAKEKIDRQRALIEQQELRKKEQAERERQRQETERRHPEDDKMRQVHILKSINTLTADYTILYTYYVHRRHWLLKG